MGRKRGSWVHVGKDLEADVFVDLDTGKTKHIGTKVTDGNVRKVYDGPPSKTGYVAGKIIQAIRGTTRRD